MYRTSNEGKRGKSYDSAALALTWRRSGGAKKSASRMSVLNSRHCGRLPHILKTCKVVVSGSHERGGQQLVNKAAAARESPQRWELCSRHPSLRFYSPHPNASIHFCSSHPSHMGGRYTPVLATVLHARIPILGVMLISIKLRPIEAAASWSTRQERAFLFI